MATELTVQETYLPNWSGFGYTPAVGDTVEILWELTDDGLDDDGFPRLHGTGPVVSATVYAWDEDDGRFEDGDGNAMPAFSPTPSQYDGPFVLYIPTFEIDPTTDWLRPRPGRYRVFFRLPDGRRLAWQDYQDIVVPVDPMPARWCDISLYNKGGVAMFGYRDTYTKEEIDAKISASGATVVGLDNQVFASPVDGSSGFLSARALVAADIPSVPSTKISDFSTAVDARITNSAVIAALGYTAENAANKGAAGGYAPLNGSSKVASTYISEVLGLGALTDVANGAAPTLNQFLVGDGTAWANRALAGSDVTVAIGYTPENAANRNATNGYAGLSAGKIAASQVQEVIALGDLTNVNTAGLTAGDLLAYDGAAFVPKGGTSRLLDVAIFNEHTPAADLGYAMDYETADPDDYWFWAYAVPGPGKVAAGFHGSYNDAAADGGANFHLSVTAHNSGKRNTVAIGGFGIADVGQTLLAEATSVWGGNFVTFTRNDTGYAGSISIEANYGDLGLAAGQSNFGIAVYAIPRPGGTTVAGVNKAAVIINTNGQVDADGDAAPLNGIVFTQNVGTYLGTPYSIPPVKAVGGVGGALIMAQSVHAAYGIAMTDGVYSLYGIDMAQSTFGEAPVRLPNSMDAAPKGIAFVDHANTGAFNGIAMQENDYLFIGDFFEASGHGVEEIQFHVKGLANRARLTGNGFSPKRLGVWPWDGSPTATAVSADISGTPAVTGSDFAGQVIFTTQGGSAPGANTKLFTLDFFDDYPDAFYVVLVRPLNSASAGANEIHARARAAGGVDFYSGDTALSNATTYTIGYVIVMVTSH